MVFYALIIFVCKVFFKVIFFIEYYVENEMVFGLIIEKKSFLIEEISTRSLCKVLCKK